MRSGEFCTLSWSVRLACQGLASVMVLYQLSKTTLNLERHLCNLLIYFSIRIDGVRFLHCRVATVNENLLCLFCSSIIGNTSDIETSHFESTLLI